MISKNWPNLTPANSKAYPISIFSIIEFLDIDTKNIYISLLCISDFIRKRSANYNHICYKLKPLELDKRIKLLY